MVLIIEVQGQEMTPFVIYDAKGKKVDFQKIVSQGKQSEIILFGEFHNNAIAHWLQYELVTALIPAKPLVLGAEMFEADHQNLLTAYLSDSITEKNFKDSCRLWPNYDTDYAPLVRIAKENKYPFIATNIPRKYAGKVFKGGFEALYELSELEKSWIAPLPVDYDPELPGYKNMLTMMGNDPAHANPNFPKAQAIKDATMAHFITSNMRQNSIFVHFNGAYHTDNDEGIIWYLKRWKSDLKYVTISTVTQKNIYKLEPEHKGKAHFIICVDEDMTNTY
jgi:uncharacterized iron-regulated protein